MPRPRCCRRIQTVPIFRAFCPAEHATVSSEPIIMTLDELEALRLADYEGLYHDEAAAFMGISRPTFSRLIATARRKVSAMLLEGKILRVEGGEIIVAPDTEKRTFVCDACGHSWQLLYGTGCPRECPECHSTNIHRDPSECRGQHGHLARQGTSGKEGRLGEQGHRKCCRHRR